VCKTSGQGNPQPINSTAIQEISHGSANQNRRLGYPIQTASEASWLDWAQDEEKMTDRGR